MRFLDVTQFALIYEMSDGTYDTAEARYRFMTYEIGGEVMVFVNERIGLGLNYVYSYTEQTLSTFYESLSGKLTGIHNPALVARIYLWRNPRIRISVSPSVGAVVGTLRRFPVLFEDSRDQNIPQEEKDFYFEINRPVTLTGISGGLRADFHFMVNRLLMIFGGPIYCFRFVTLKDDRFPEYPSPLISNEFGFNINISLMINGLNTNIRDHGR